MIAVGVELFKLIGLITVFSVERQLGLRQVVDVVCKPVLPLNELLVNASFARPNADNVIRPFPCTHFCSSSPC